MIEIYDNLLQVTVLLGCLLYTVWKQIRTRSKKWTPMLLFYGCEFLSIGYWLLYVALLRTYPQYSNVSDFGSYAGVLFLCILLQTPVGAPEPESQERGGLLPWIGPLISAAAFLFFIQWERYTSNLLAALAMGYLGYWSIRMLRQKGPLKQFALSCLLHFCLEYVLWFVSCFWAEDSLTNPYYWIDVLVSLNFIFVLMSYRKAVAE